MADLIATHEKLVRFFHDAVFESVCVHNRDATQCEEWAKALLASGIVQTPATYAMGLSRNQVVLEQWARALYGDLGSDSALEAGVRLVAEPARALALTLAQQELGVPVWCREHQEPYCPRHQQPEQDWTPPEGTIS